LPPSKPQPWTGVRDALEVAPKAPQARAGALVAEYAPMDWNGPMSEDCLRLNLWTPGLKDNKKRPVMLWLHGGGYARSSANSDLYNGTHLATVHDVVVVGANHRLNILGYLYLAGTGDARYANSSNMGMQDIVFALEWIRDNISNFGGDPNNVTIWGQSGGAGGVAKQQRRLGVIDDVLEHGHRYLRAEHHEHRAYPRARVQHRRREHVGRERDDPPVTALYPGAGEPAGQPQARLPQLLVGQRGTAPSHRGAPRRPVGCPVQQVVQQAGRGHR
jgi:para-nitrobenzyl esterase